MRHALAILLLAACGSAAAQVPPATQAMLDNVRADSLRGHLSFLASDLLEGRGTPSRGQELAAEYIAAQFRRAGLEPAGDDGYFQTATWLYGTRDMKEFRLTLSSGGKQHALALANFVVRARDGVDLRDAPVVHVTQADAAFAPDSLAGAVVVIDLPELADPSAMRKALGQVDKILRAARPAVAIRIDRHHAADDGGDIGVLTDPSQPKQPATGTQAWITAHGAEAADLLHALPQGKSGATLTLHVPAPVTQPVKLRNVIGVLRGSDPKLKDTYVMLTAHYDHLGKRGNVIYNGANDDGSGTVSVIEIAGALAGMHERPKRSIVFMTLFGEELGLRGSRYYGEHPIFPIAKTVADVNLEQVGRTDSSEGPQLSNASMTGFDFSDMGAIFQRAGEATGIKVYKHPFASDQYFDASDNQSLADQGIPAHTLCVAYEYPDYHGPGDHWEKVDYVNMAKVDRMIALGVWAIANDPVAPRWNEANPKARRFAEAAHKLSAGTP